MLRELEVSSFPLFCPLWGMILSAFRLLLFILHKGLGYQRYQMLGAFFPRPALFVDLERAKKGASQNRALFLGIIPPSRKGNPTAAPISRTWGIMCRGHNMASRV